MPTSIIRQRRIHVHAYALLSPRSCWRACRAVRAYRADPEAPRMAAAARSRTTGIGPSWSKSAAATAFSNTAAVETFRGGAIQAAPCFTYCANAQNGARPRLSTTGCGFRTSVRRSRSSQGTMSGSSVAGNLYLAGGALQRRGTASPGGLSATSGQAGELLGNSGLHQDVGRCAAKRSPFGAALCQAERAARRGVDSSSRNR